MTANMCISENNNNNDKKNIPTYQSIFSQTCYSKHNFFLV